ncbi:hypothetical protein [Agitococcus lubricus]|uniref:DNA-binding protein n=1 Tax=Agitococcus lubricus TaxID=1077255 RepID=A0A2T5J422_9GAMM|nr:hypothetical protein [Agitococcus lubricus]PTQ91298.1 hypothetical protein C8N29_101371 [Agitococcus lubricus]
MSLAQQEQALFALLFDSERQQQFCQHGIAALADFGLSRTELADFRHIRASALQYDSQLRIDFILAQFCRALPLSFSLIKALTGSVDFIRQQLSYEVMQQETSKRLLHFAKQLKPAITRQAFANRTLLAILAAETAMISTSYQLKMAYSQGKPFDTKSVLDAHWQTRPLRIADYVSVSVLPLSYPILKQGLCPYLGSELWHYLQQSNSDHAEPLTFLHQEDPRLLVSLAYISHHSPCDMTIDHTTIELSEGFAPLLDAVDGELCVNQLLAYLQKAGAPHPLLQSVAMGFRHLLQQGMLIFND